MSGEKSINQLVLRTNLTIPVDKLLEQVFTSYPLGKLKEIKPIFKGYEDFNSKITTSKGVYVLKVFCMEKSKRLLDDYIKALLFFKKNGVVVPKLIESKEGYLYKVKQPRANVYLCVMEYFSGKKFTQTSPTIKDIKEVVKNMALIHKLHLRVISNYDSWGTANLAREYNFRRKSLENNHDAIIRPIVENFSKIYLDKLPRSVIHGDIQKEHVLKDTRGNYCIIDFGCLDYNASILDLTIFIALFCIDFKLSEEKNRKRIFQTLSEYQKYRKLTKTERQAIPILIMATYAIYFIRSNYEYVINGDRSSQTRNWRKWGWKGLEIFQNLKLETDDFYHKYQKAPPSHDGDEW